MKKRLKLYKMINGSRMSDQIYWLLIVVLSALGGFLTYRFADYISMAGGIQTVLNLSGVVASILIIALGLVKLINSMYMSGDVELIITLPFASYEIAVMKVLDYYRLAALFGIVIVAAPGIGYSLGSGAVPANIIAAAVGGILIPVFNTCLIAIIVVLLMSFVKIFRSRQVLRIIGMFLIFGLLCIYMFVLNHDNDSSGLAHLMQMSAEISAVLKYVLPIVGFLCEFAASQNALFILAVIGITAAAAVIFYLVTSTLYLRGTLNMMDDVGGKHLRDSDMEKKCRKNSVIKTLIRKEFLSVRRNPAFTLNNFIIGALWPLLAVLMMRGMIPMFEDMFHMAKQDTINLQSFGMYSSIISVIVFFVIMLPIASHTLAGSFLSREGIDFPIMKQIPVSYKTQIDAKRRMSMKVSLICVMIYVVILVIVVSAIFNISFVYGIIPIVETWFYVRMNVDSDMFFSIDRSDVSWTNEKEAAKKCTMAVIMNFIYWIVGLVISFALVFTVSTGDLNGGIAILIQIVLCVVMAAASIIFKKQIYIKGEKKIRKMRF